MAGPSLSSILGGGGKDVDVESEADEAPEIDAAKDILAAIKANDPKALSLALERHTEACASPDESTEDDSEEY